jgi:hypothetical protein
MHASRRSGATSSRAGARRSNCRRGEGWLDTHPARDEIVSRYLVHQRGLVRDAIARLTAEEQPEEEQLPSGRTSRKRQSNDRSA